MDGFIMSFEDDCMNAQVFDYVQIKNITDHNELEGRDAEGSHPIAAIEGLAKELDSLTAHTKDGSIHVTAQEKENWNNKVNVLRNASGALIFYR